MVRIALLSLMCLAACSVPDPPLAGDHSTPKYQADITRCRSEAAAKARRRQNATPQALIMSAFDSGKAEQADVLACMQARGYGVAG